MLKYIESYLLPRCGWLRVENGWHKRKYEVTWEQQNLSHEDHDVYNQIEDKDDYVHLVFEVMTHKKCWH